MWWDDYASPGCWDEFLDGGRARPACEGVFRAMSSLTRTELRDRQSAADLAVRAMGITFTLYGEARNLDRAWPFDVIPRVLSTTEWAGISSGLVQRLTAINMFIDDVYGDGRILDDGVVPRDIVLGSANYREQCRGVKPSGGVWAHVCGSDLVRDVEGTVLVLEDNLRVPSGVSYMLENRQLTKRVFADLFRDLDLHPVDGYPNRLLELLGDLSPRPGERPTIVLLTPGVANSAYFEHAWLAQEMGVHLVEGGDLVIDGNDCVYLRTIEGLTRVDVIYRRIDDLFLDPLEFREDSMLGVAGLMRAWRAGNVAIVNAPGAGVADDKVVYAFMPEIIRYYLGEEAKVPNVPTWLCADPVQRSHVLAHLDELVVKPANESGGHGVVVGPMATTKEKEELRRRIEAEPRVHVAQPVIDLSTAPTLTADGIAPRHVDLRPFILSAERPYVTQGGLTRVALSEGSLVVNSSQGGGSKDTWVLDPSFVAAGRQAQIQSRR